MHSQLCLCLIGLIASSLAFAKSKSLQVNPLITIQYSSPSWNQNAGEIDSAFLIIRDRATKKLVQIRLEETEPDSSIFQGYFNVGIGESAKFAPEVFVPPPGLRQSTDNNKKIFEMIQSGQLKRRAVIKKKLENGQPLLAIYDNPAQAKVALKAYKEELRLTRMQAKLAAGSKGAASDYSKKMKEMDLEASKREVARKNLQLLEAQKLALRRAKFRSLPLPEQERRKARAATNAEEAMGHYQKAEYAQAEEKFQSASELDPEEKSYYFRYGVSQFRVDKLSEALVTLNVAEVAAEQANEKEYYKGLIHYRLQELNMAATKFAKVSKSEDPTLGPSALFYLGMIQFAQEKYEAAKKSFEDVIDTSQDPKMDEQAEAYLDKIASALAFKKLQETKWAVTGTLGVMYDSNVLLSSDAAIDQGTATDIDDYRLLTSGGLTYRPLYTQKHEFSAKLDISLTNSTKDQSATADPYIYDLNLPYSYKTTLWEKAYKVTTKPGYELLYMDYDDSGSKKLAYGSYWLNVDNTFVFAPRWISTLTLEYRVDDSHTTDSVGTSDADSNKYSAKTAQTFLLGADKKHIVMLGLGMIMNSAKGDDKTYDRIEGGLTYVRPIYWGMSWSSSYNLYKVSYDDASTVREDSNSALAMGLSKSLRDWVTWGLNGSYAINDSNVDAYTYSKWLVMTTATFNTRF